jgi:hypothetical protein
VGWQYPRCPLGMGLRSVHWPVLLRGPVRSLVALTHAEIDLLADLIMSGRSPGLSVGSLAETPVLGGFRQCRLPLRASVS